MGALALGELRAEFDAHVAAIVAERARLEAAFSELRGMSFTPSRANFVLVRFGERSARVLDALAAAGIAVRAFSGHGAALDGLVRITVGTPSENDALLTVLTRALR